MPRSMKELLLQATFFPESLFAIIRQPEEPLALPEPAQLQQESDYDHGGILRLLQVLRHQNRGGNAKAAASDSKSLYFMPSDH